MPIKLHWRQVALFGVAGTALSTSPATLAQDAPSAAQGERKVELEEIIVTGTQIRGVAPVGSNVVGVNEQEIEATGAVTMNQLLSQLPQSSDFNNITQPGGGVLTANGRVPITRPNIRNLPGAGGSASGAVTLVLINGHRVVPQGIEQTAVDADIVAPDATERVETILDGASAVYGSDAAGGVINFITRRSFEGIKFDARYGVADDYESWRCQYHRPGHPGTRARFSPLTRTPKAIRSLAAIATTCGASIGRRAYRRDASAMSPMPPSPASCTQCRR